MKAFSRPPVFPNEAFIQESIEKHFVANKYEIDSDGQVDLIAWNEKSEKWIIEAKGMSESVRTDFNTCIGQLVGHMDSDNENYAIALPKVDRYLYQCRKLPDYIREKLCLHIILVDDNGDVRIIYPNENIED